MKTKDPTKRFSDRVDDYVKYRPGYPEEIIPLLSVECGLTAKTVIADIGSGTGKLTVLFLENGNSVFCVEPNREMREADGRLPGHFISVDATAEATKLPDKSVNMIVSGQAFHWFDHQKARTEFQRILKPGGWVVLVWNDRRVDSTPFLAGYDKLLREFGTDYEQVNHRRIDAKILRKFYGADPKLKTFPYSQYFDYEGLEGRLLSSSYAPGPGQPKHQEMLAALEKLFATHAEKGRVAFDYDTLVYYGCLA